MAAPSGLGVQGSEEHHHSKPLAQRHRRPWLVLLETFAEMVAEIRDVQCGLALFVLLCHDRGDEDEDGEF